MYITVRAAVHEEISSLVDWDALGFGLLSYRNDLPEQQLENKAK